MVDDRLVFAYQFKISNASFEKGFVVHAFSFIYVVHVDRVHRNDGWVHNLFPRKENEESLYGHTPSQR